MATGGIWRWIGARLGGRAVADAQAQADLAEARLRDAIDAIPEGVVFLDAEGRYILWNRRYAEIYHRSADLFRPGARLIDTLREGVARGDYPDAIGCEAAWLAEREAKLARATGERHEQQVSDGRWLMIEERRTSDGGVIGLRVDITEMKQQAAALEEALVHAEAAHRAKAEFLADMSHELRTPLNGVLGLAQALDATDLCPEQRALVSDIRAAARQLNRIVNGLLDYGDADLAVDERAGVAGPDRPLRVLAADDNPTNRKVIELMLEAAGVQVTTVENGYEAVEAWRAGGYDAVLMDLRMPVTDGLAAIRTIRKDEASLGRARTPTIVLSANTSPEDRAASAAAGADGHIAKPIRVETLFAALDAALSSQVAQAV